LAVLAVASLAALPLAAADLSLVVPRVALERTFRVGIQVSAVQDLYGAALDLVYDASYLSVVDLDADPANGLQPQVEESAFLGEGGATQTVRAQALENDLQGRVVLGLVRKGQVMGTSTVEPRLLASVVFRARSEGTAQVRLEGVVLRDSAGGTIPVSVASVASLEITSSVTNTVPVAAAGPDVTLRPGRIYLDGSRSVDPEGSILLYTWTQTSGSTVTLTGATQPVAVFETAADGVYAFRLQVSDGLLSSTDDVQITVAAATNSRPVAAVRTPQDSSGAVPITYVLRDAEGDPVSVVADYSTNGGNSFSPARIAGGDGTTGLAASADGDAHTFLWNSVADLGATRVAGVLFRLRPSDAGGAGAVSISQGFTVDNSSTRVLVSIRRPAPNSTFFVGQLVSFEGFGTDSSGNDLSVSSLAWRSDIQGALGVGSLLTTQLTTGSHVVTLTGTDSLSRSASTTLEVRVVPRPELAGALTVTGRVTLAGTGANAPDGTLVTFFNLVRRISSGALLSSGDGVYSAVLSRPDNLAASPGDPILVSVHNANRVLLTAQPASFVLTLTDFIERIHIQNLQVAGQTSLVLERGLNLIALPSDPSTTATPFTAADLASRTGAQYVVRVVSAGAGQPGRFQVYLPGGLTPAFALSGDQGYLVRVPESYTLTYTGRPWSAAALSRRLHQGVNLIAFPRGVPAGWTVGDLAFQAGSRIVTRFDRDPAEAGGTRTFRAFLPVFGAEPEPVENGKAYLIVAPTEQDITLPSR
jgi:hypothetical protein